MAKAKTAACPCGAKSKKKHNIGCIRRKPLAGESGRVMFNSPVTPPPKTRQRYRNTAILLIDRSGSMAGKDAQVSAGVNTQLASIRAGANANGVDVDVKVFEFHSVVSSRFWGDKRTVAHRVELVNGGYRPGYAGGGTPLIDAIFEVTKGYPPTDTYFLWVATDGQENESTDENKREFGNLISNLLRAGNWTITFVGPATTKSYLTGFGIPAGNILEWEGGAQEFVKHVSPVTSRSVGSYYNSVSMGVKSTASFYEAKVDDNKAVNKLPDVTGAFIQTMVDVATPIKDYVERVKGSYRPGDAFYELTKDTEVQDYKAMFLLDGRNGTVKGGDVRSVLGLPTQGTARVKPGNLKGHKVFVESTSLNRKLVPGTTLLIRK